MPSIESRAVALVFEVESMADTNETDEVPNVLIVVGIPSIPIDVIRWVGAEAKSDNIIDAHAPDQRSSDARSQLRTKEILVFLTQAVARRKAFIRRVDN